VRNKVSCNDDGGEDEEAHQTSTIFNHPNHFNGTSSKVFK